VDQVRQPLRFSDAVATMLEQPLSGLLELGPDAILTAMITRLSTTHPPPAGSGHGSPDSSGPPRGNDRADRLAELFVRGVVVVWAGLVPVPTGPVALPYDGVSIEPISGCVRMCRGGTGCGYG